MLSIKKLLLLACLIFIGMESNSQPPKPTPAAASKKLVLTPKFGAYTDSSKPFATDLKQIMKAELRVTDNTGTVWTIVTYRLGWRKKEMSDDYKTGQRKTVNTFNAVTVDNSGKIPEGWQKELSENLQAGEQLLFEEIIAQDPKTKKMMKVSSLRLFPR